MTKSSRIGFVLAFLVLGVFLMRNSDVSVGTATKHALRRVLFQVVNGAPIYTSSAGQKICSGLNIDSPFSASELEQAQSVKASVQSMRGGNPLRVALEGGSVDFAKYATGLISLVAPWAALFVISAFICLCLCCSWCCMHGCCKNTKCCACCKQPQIFKKKWVYVGITVLMLLGTFSGGIAGAVFSGKVPNGLALTLCSFVGMVEDFIDGRPDKQFMGLAGAKQNLQNIINSVNSTVDAMNSMVSHDSALQTKYDTTVSSIDTLYNNNKNGVAQRGAGDVTSTPATTYTPAYIQNLGPKETATTAAGTMYSEITVQYKVVNDSLAAIGPAVTALKGARASIQSTLEGGRDAIAEIQKTINDFLDAIGGIGSTAKDVFSGIGSALVAIFVVFIVIAVLVIISILVILKKKVKFLNKFLHFSWCVMGLLTILTWIVSALFYPVSIVLMEVCDVIEVVLTSDASRRSIFSGVTSGTAVDMFTDCLSGVGDPDFAKPFNIESQLGDFKSIFTSLGSVSKEFPSLTTAPTSGTITQNTASVQDVLDGKVADATQIADDLIALNKATNKATSSPASCTTVQDRWVFGSVLCTTSGEYTFASGDIETQNVNNPTCIGFDNWGSKTIAPRYSGKFTSCSNLGSPASSAETYVTNSVNNFKKHRSDIQTLFGTVKSNLGTVQTNYNALSSGMFTHITNFKNLNSSVSSLADSLDGTTNGLLNNLKCGFVRTDLLRISNSMCTGFVVNFYQTSVALIVTSFFTLFSTIAVFLLTKRILLPEYLAAKTSPSGFSPPVNQFSPY